MMVCYLLHVIIDCTAVEFNISLNLYDSKTSNCGNKYSSSLIITYLIASFLGSVKSLFWSIYRYSPPKHVDVVTTEYYDIDSNNHTVIHVNKHHFTETVGYLLFGVSQVVLQIVMQNMFVAMSAIQYGQVQVSSK